MAQADDFFGGGYKSANFLEKNKKVGGEIVSIQEQRQQREPNGDLKWWDKAETEPMMQLPIDVQTDLRDPQDPADDGIRTIYVKGDMKRAIGEAVRKAGQRGAPKVGGQLWVAWTDTQPATTRGYNDKKIYTAMYVPPSGNDDFFGSQPKTDAQPAAVGASSTDDEPPF